MAHQPKYELPLSFRASMAAVELDAHRLGEPLGYKAVRDVALVIKEIDKGRGYIGPFLWDVAHRTLEDYEPDSNIETNADLISRLNSIGQELEKAESLSIEEAASLRDFCIYLSRRASEHASQFRRRLAG